MSVHIPEWLQGADSSRYEVVLIRRFPPQETRKRQFDVEEAFRGYLGADSISTPFTAPMLSNQVPAAQLRFLIEGPKAQLQVTDNSATLVMRFDNGIPSSGLLKPIARAVAEMDKFDDLFAGQDRFFCAMAVTGHFPFSDKSKMFSAMEAFSDDGFKKPIGLPSILNLTYGRSVGEVERILEMNRYVQFLLEAKANTALFVDPDFTDGTSEAILVRYELNTKPLKEKPKQKSFQGLLNELKAWASEDQDGLLAWKFGKLS